MSWKQTSPDSFDYNCIAWALGFNHLWLWPEFDYEWPRPKPEVLTTEEFSETFKLFGYEPCNSEIFEAGFEKIALYLSINGEPQHAARQLAEGELMGKWTSKLGAKIDIAHDRLSDFPDRPPYGPCTSYGGAALFFKRRRSKERPTYEEIVGMNDPL